MTEIKSTEDGKPIIKYRIPGTEAEYVQHLKAMTKAVASSSLDENERKSLSSMLVNMLPDENQVKL